MITSLLKDTKEDIKKAAEIIASGGLVAFPTETVYGLGADALNADAVSKVYAAKGRPSDNPMIVHISSTDDIPKLTDEITADMKTLMDAFWPGPMTMIVNRKPIIPDVTTGGLDTVGIRMPDNETARLLIEMSGCPIAAPSANLSGKPSPTTYKHVVEDLEGRIDAIIMSGDCEVGIESTVIDMTGETPMILRPGGITKQMIEGTLGKEILLDPTLNKRPDLFNNNLKPKAPGMKYKHYAPEAKVVLYDGEPKEVLGAMQSEKKRLESEGKKVSLIFFDKGEDKKAAHELFARLRLADSENADFILVNTLAEEGLGFSVMNRMLKSAGYNIKKI